MVIFTMSTFIYGFKVIILLISFNFLRGYDMNLKLLGNRIKELRITQHLSQDKLGELTGLNGKYLGEVERGNANISINNLSKISIALNIPLTNLIDINHEQNKEILIDELHKIINSANTKQLKLIYKIINDIIY